MTIHSADVHQTLGTVDRILDYVEHVLEMPSPPTTVAIPTKMLVSLKQGVRWSPNSEKETDV